MPKDGPISFTIIHTNGIHPVRIVFCGCASSVHPRQQLLRRGWFPATIHQPHTCATFTVLNHFHLQTLHSKLTATHFIAAIERETDNTGLVPVKVWKIW
jgi:CxC2 like cysteine cluster associated with KDZ transposases